MCMTPYRSQRCSVESPITSITSAPTALMRAARRTEPPQSTGRWRPTRRAYSGPRRPPGSLYGGRQLRLSLHPTMITAILPIRFGTPRILMLSCAAVSRPRPARRFGAPDHRRTADGCVPGRGGRGFRVGSGRGRYCPRNVILGQTWGPCRPMTRRPKQDSPGLRPGPAKGPGPFGNPPIRGPGARPLAGSGGARSCPMP
jgi:hypothetical protein